MDNFRTITVPVKEILEEGFRYREGPSERGFLVGLYVEHLEEASFLYEQRLSLLNDAQLRWTDLQPFEERFEAHIDALVVGGNLALAVCLQQTVDGDFGELHAALRVFCRQDRYDLFSPVIDKIDPDNAETVKAAADALCHELPDAWIDPLEKQLRQRPKPGIDGLIIRAFGYRRIKKPDLFRIVLERSAKPTDISSCIWAFGRIGIQGIADKLLKTLQTSTEPQIREQAALALVRHADHRALPVIVQSTAPWVPTMLGIAGTGKAAELLLQRAMDPRRQDRPRYVIALGLAGHANSIDFLLSALDNKDLADHAATALYLMTGAELPLGEKLKRNEEDKSDVGDADAEAKPTVLAPWISRDAEAWRGWWKEHAHTFPKDGFCIWGTVKSGESVLASLRRNSIPINLRNHLSSFFLLPQIKRAHIETDMTVARQNALLA